MSKAGEYVCTNCGNREQAEREVFCWKCGGKGEMVWTPASKATKPHDLMKPTGINSPLKKG